MGPCLCGDPYCNSCFPGNDGGAGEAIADWLIDLCVIRIPFALGSETSVTRNGRTIFQGIGEEIPLITAVRDAIQDRLAVRNAQVPKIDLTNSE